MTLSKREKIMLAVLGVFVTLAAIVMLLVMPALERMDELRTQLSEVETRKSNLETSVLAKEELQLTLNGLKKEAQDMYKVLGMTKSYDTSLFITQMYEKYSLEPLSLSISNYEVVEIRPQRTPEEIQAESGSEEETEAVDYAYKKTATASFYGDYASAMAMLDEISNISNSIHVEAFGVGNKDDKLNYNMTLAMYEFLSPEQALLDAGGKPVVAEE